ncbi:hypothetical protein EV656_103316 [Rhodovulum adriaticum]|uniref:Uncharacterized protein n=1 Tax=Rhodovulum adriaticum TaxID=35804 RepID=A0A4R2NU99_RHOAD|nr:hypothetical protein EV656_103316 [Rhodovulum adriaticum]
MSDPIAQGTRADGGQSRSRTRHRNTPSGYVVLRWQVSRLADVRRGRLAVALPSQPCRPVAWGSLSGHGRGGGCASDLVALIAFPFHPPEGGHQQGCDATIGRKLSSCALAVLAAGNRARPGPGQAVRPRPGDRRNRSILGANTPASPMTRPRRANGGYGPAAGITGPAAGFSRRASSAIWAGPISQQPPTVRAPSATQPWANSA